LFMLVSLCIFPKFHSIRVILILSITVTDLITSLLLVGSSYYYLSHNELIPLGPACNFVGGAIQYFEVATTIFIACLSAHIHLLVRHNKKLKGVKYGILYVAIGFLFPLILVAFVVGLSSYDQTAVWCWISATPTYARLVFVLDIPVVVMILILVLDVISVVHIYRISRNSGRHTVHIRAMRRLAAYPLVFFFVWLPLLINRWQNAADPKHPSFGLYFFQAVITPLQGAMNAIIYGVNENLIEMYQKCLPGKNNEEDNNSSSTNKELVVNRAESEWTSSLNDRHLEINGIALVNANYA